MVLMEYKVRQEKNVKHTCLLLNCTSVKAFMAGEICFVSGKFLFYIKMLAVEPFRVMLSFPAVI